MKTKIFSKDEIRDIEIDEIISAFKRGEIIAFPSETVYGLGALYTLSEGIKKIYEVKGRPSDNPLILHIGDMKSIGEIAADFPVRGKKLGEAFWPGPLTLIVKKRDVVKDFITGGLDTVGIRYPDNLIVERILKRGNLIIAAPSANISGRPSPTTSNHVLDDLDGAIWGVIEGGSCIKGVESTIVDISGKEVEILRPGSITKEMIADVLGEEVIDGTAGTTSRVRAPGMKYTHYAPKGISYVIFKPNRDKIERAIKKLGKKNFQVLAFEESRERLKGLDSSHIEYIGSSKDLEEGLKNIYSALRNCDKLKRELVFVEGLKGDGLIDTFMNRVEKACGGRVII